MMSFVAEPSALWISSSGGSRGGSKGSMEPPFGFSCDRKLWKPGLQQNPTI